jgi:WD40 repeat protein
MCRASPLGDPRIEFALMEKQLADPGFLVHANPGHVLALLPAAQSPEDRLAAAVYRASAHVHRLASPAVRRQLLALDAARYGESGLVSRITAVPVEDAPAPVWVVCWASGGQVDPRLRHTLVHDGCVSMVVTGLVEGTSAATDRVTHRPVAITYDDRGERFWDLATGEPDEEPELLLETVVPVLFDGRPVALTGSGDGVVHVCDPGTGDPVGAPLTGHDGEITATAMAVVDGGPVAVTGSFDGTVRVWDLTAEPVGRPRAGHHDVVASVAWAGTDDRLVAVTGSYDGSVRTWDPVTGVPTGQLSPVARNDLVSAVATAVVDGRPVAVASHSGSTVSVWDLATGQQTGQLTGGSPAVTVIDGRPAVVTADRDGTIRLWDLATGQQVGPHLTGHHGEVYALAAARFGGRAVAVTSGEDQTVRIWDLVSRRQIGQPLTGHDREVWAAAAVWVDGRLLAITGSGDKTVRVWDPVTGRQDGDSLCHEGEVWAVTSTVIDGRPVAVTGGSGGSNGAGTVRTWDLVTRLQIAPPLVFPLPVHSLAVGPGGRLLAGFGHETAVFERPTQIPEPPPARGRTGSSI